MTFLYILLLYTLSVNSAETLLDKDITTVDIVLRGIKDQSWEEHERLCLDQTLTILNNVRNHTVWAVWIWNSMENPIGIFYGSRYTLGNYDQCLNAPTMAGDTKIITQYCLADIQLTGKKYEKDDRSVLGYTEAYLGIKTNIGRDFKRVTWGTCLPSICKPQSMSKILNTIYSTNPVTPDEPKITVNTDYCQVAGKNKELSFGFYTFLIFITSLVVVCVLSTYFLPNTKLKSPGALHSIAYSFCLNRNWASLTKESKEEMGILNFFKVAVATVTVGLHLVVFKGMGPISNGLQIDELLLNTDNPLKVALKHMDLPTDSFFMVSGLLLVKGLMERNKNALVSLVQRYFRLIASFAVVIFYISTVSIYTGDGPIWQRFAGREQKTCSDNWILAVLMLNNYMNSENICLLVSWYIPCDYHLAVMGTILFLVWRRNKMMGQVSFTITVVLSVFIPGIVTYWRRLPGMLFFHDIEKILEMRINDVFLDTYIRSHNRAGPYLLGMAMGYVISVYNPNKYRKVISKKWSMLLLVVANMVLIKVMMYTLAWSTLEYDHLSSAVYAACSRNLWALSLCLIVGVFEYGDVGYLHKLLNWHGLTVVSRLTYGIYLCHSLILHQYLYSRRNLQQLDMVHLEVIHTVGIFIASGFLAMLLWLFIEAPFNNIVNIFIDSGSKDKYRHLLTEDKKTLTDKIESAEYITQLHKKIKAF